MRLARHASGGDGNELVSFGHWLPLRIDVIVYNIALMILQVAKYCLIHVPDRARISQE